MKLALKYFSVFVSFIAFISSTSAILKTHASTGDGKSSNIQLLDVNTNGTIDTITFDIATPSRDTWRLTGTLPHGLSVTQNNQDIIITSVNLENKGEIATVTINLNEDDEDLVPGTDGVNTNALELSYNGFGSGGSCNQEDCISDDDEQLNVILPLDGDESNTEKDSARPLILKRSFSTGDDPLLVDRVILEFSEAVSWQEGFNQLSIRNNSLANFSQSGQPLALVSGNQSEVLIFKTSGTNSGTGIENDNPPTLAYLDKNNTQENIVDLAGNTLIPDDVQVPLLDEARPALKSININTIDGVNTITLEYSEKVYFDSEISNKAFGDLENGELAGLISFGSSGDIQVTSGGNRIIGNESTTISIQIADIEGASIITKTGDMPGGKATPIASKSLLDEAGNRVNPLSAVNTNVNNSWDLIGPQILQVIIRENSDINGKIDEAEIIFSEAIDEASLDLSELKLGDKTGRIITGIVNDPGFRFVVNSDNNPVNTEHQEFTYLSRTNPITDLAGNPLRTTVPGKIGKDDIQEIDKASPLLVGWGFINSGAKIVLEFTEPIASQSINLNQIIFQSDLNSSVSFGLKDSTVVGANDRHILIELSDNDLLQLKGQSRRNSNAPWYLRIGPNALTDMNGNNNVVLARYEAIIENNLYLVKEQIRFSPTTAVNPSEIISIEDVLNSPPEAFIPEIPENEDVADVLRNDKSLSSDIIQDPAPTSNESQELNKGTLTQEKIVSNEQTTEETTNDKPNTSTLKVEINNSLLQACQVEPTFIDTELQNTLESILNSSQLEQWSWSFPYLQKALEDKAFDKDSPLPSELRPDTKISRGEFLNLLVELFKLEKNGFKQYFPDVRSNTPYAEAISTAASLGIITGYKDGFFRPRKVINRAEAVVLVMRAAEIDFNNKNSQKSEFLDLEEKSWYTPAVNLAKKLGFIKGTKKNVFQPDAAITRGQAIKVLYKTQCYRDVLAS